MSRTRISLPAAAALAAGALWATSALAIDVSEGRRIYIEVCAACHANGVAGAPRFGNRQEWEMRQLRGRKEMLQSVMKGRGSMPPKGGNPSVSDAQAQAAMDYLLASVK